MADAYFEQEVLRMYADGSNASLAQVAKTAMAGLREETLRVQPTRDQWKVFNKVLDDVDSKSFNKLPSGELKSLAAVRLMSRVRSVKDLDNIFFETVKDAAGNKVIQETAMGKHLKAVSGSEAMQRVWNEAERIGQAVPGGAVGDLAKHSFTKGAFKGLHVRLPKGIVDDLRRWGNSYDKPEEVRPILKAIDLYTNTFKLTHTSLFPSFNFRNANSNLVAVAGDIGLQAYNLPAHKTMVDILRGADGTFTTDVGRRYTYSQFRSIMNGLGITVDHTAIAELVGQERTLLPFLESGKLAKVVQFVPRNIENEARAMHFFTNVRRGKTVEEAMSLTKEFLFDYSMLSDAEQNWMRRAIPFYTWQSKNVRLQAKLLATKPGYAATQYKLLGRERGPEAESLPSWLRGDTKIQLNHPKGGAMFLTGLDLPVNNMDVLWKGSLGATMREHIGMITPILKNPLEYAINLDTFTHQPVQGRKWLGRFGGTLNRRLSNQLKDYFELKEIPLKRGGFGYTMNGTKFHLVTKALLMSRLFSDAVRVETVIHDFYGDRPNAANELAKFLTGMQLNEFDATERQKAELRNKTERLADLMISKGYAAEFTKDFIPASVLQDARRAQQ